MLVPESPKYYNENEIAGRGMGSMLRLGIIGCGNMGGAMLRQMLKAGVFSADEVLVSDHSQEVRSRLEKELGVHTVCDNRQAAALPYLLLAVKPQYAQEVCREIADSVSADTLVLSIVTGLELSRLCEILNHERLHLIRVMPNTPALVGEGVLAACRGKEVTEEEWAFAMKALSSMGVAEEVPEHLMDAVTGVSGSSPAFAFLFLEALADAGVRAGLSRAVSQRFAAQVLAGSGKLALETGLHPGQLKDMVTSPAGTTIEGVAALEKAGFRSAVLEAVDAAVRKAKSFHK